MCGGFWKETRDSMPLQPSRPMPIPEGHPLRHLFRNLTEESLEQVGTTDPELTVYVTGLLVDFTHVENLYRIRDAKGRRLEYLVDFQLESQRVTPRMRVKPRNISAITRCLS